MTVLYVLWMAAFLCVANIVTGSFYKETSEMEGLQLLLLPDAPKCCWYQKVATVFLHLPSQNALWFTQLFCCQTQQ